MSGDLVVKFASVTSMMRTLLTGLLSLPARYHLLMAFAFVLALRAFNWLSHGGLYLKAGSFDLDDYLATSRFLFGQTGGVDAKTFATFRPTQILYPIALAPIHLFGWSAQAYVFCLHALCTLGMVYFAYLIGTELVGRKYGILAAWATAMNPLPLMFFTWMLPDTFYFFFVTLFVYLALVAWRTLSVASTLALLGTGVALFTIKPEAMALCLGAFGFLAYLHLRRYVRALWAAAILLTALGTVILAVAVIVLQTPRVQRALLSHIHVAHGLWMSTHIVANPHGFEQEQTYTFELPKLLEGLRGEQAMQLMSRTSLEIIRQDKPRYLYHAAIRATAILFPWFYREWEGLWTIKEIGLTMFSAVGMLVAIFANRRRTPFIGFGLCVLAMLGFVSFYVNDGNLRFRVPIQCMLLIAAPYGWLWLFDRTLGRSGGSCLDTLRDGSVGVAHTITS